MERGGVIAFVGSEATGKSTIIAEMERRLRDDHRVWQIHVGKPPATVLTAIPHLLLPTLRAVFPGKRSTRLRADSGAPRDLGTRSVPLMFAVRSAMLGYERRAVLLRAARRARDGSIVLCDRFPTPDGPDGPQLQDATVSGALARWLQRLEGRCYRSIPPPAAVVRLTAPLEVTLARNASREKVEPEDYVRRRYAASQALRFDGLNVCSVDTDRSISEAMDDVEAVIRRAVGESSR